MTGVLAGAKHLFCVSLRTRLTQQDIDAFNAQYPGLVVRHTTSFHDRFLVLDDSEGHLIGAPLKDAGKKSFGIVRLEDENIVREIMGRLW